MDEKSVYVILVSYGHADLTIACINSLRECGDVSLKIIVVDNCSPDNTFMILKDEYEHSTDIVLIQSSENGGFAAGNNIGIKYALDKGAEYIMLLNNDTEVSPDMVKTLRENCDNDTVVAPKIYNFDDPERIWFAGSKYCLMQGRFKHIGENEVDGMKYQKNFECDFLTGCCFMITREAAMKVGPMDESYFMYVEDVDYSLRLRNLGIKLMMIPDAKLWHKVGKSSGGATSIFSIYYVNRNILYLHKKFKYSIYSRSLCLITSILLMIKGVLLNTNLKYIRSSIIDYYANRMGRQRQRES